MKYFSNFKRLAAAVLCCSIAAGCASTEENSSASTATSADTKAVAASAAIADTESTENAVVTAEAEQPVTAVVNSEVTMENQTLGMEGISNARQLGGYITEDGMRIKDDILLRSGKLSDGTEQDLARLADEYGVTEIVDFRTSMEISSAPDPQIEGAENIQIRILDESGAEDNSNSAIAGIYANMGDDPAAAMLEMYRMGALKDDMYNDLLTNEVSLSGYRRFVDVLLSHEDGAILWHCTGGKDRAGMAAVITLTLLGVDKETILQDFALTNTFNQSKISYMVAGASKLTTDQQELDGVAALVGVSRELMEAAYELAEAESGSMLEYLKEKLSITDEEISLLRSKYLEPVT